MAQLDIAPYARGDEIKIRELFKTVYGREMTPEYWRWRFVDNPAGRLMIDLCWDGDTLAGHYAVSPVKMSIGGKEYLTALSMTTMTHPGYRKMGIFTTLARTLYRRLQGQGVVMVWGFPNENSYPGFVNKLNWIPLARIPRLVKRDLKNFPLNGGAVPELPVTEVFQADRRFDDFWSAIEKSGWNMVVRDSAYLQWRYFDNPVNRYRVFATENGDGISGYAVTKIYRGDGEPGGEIVDLLALDNRVAGRLITHAIGELYGQGVAKVTAWMNPAALYYRVMEDAGFAPGEDTTHLGAMINSPVIAPSTVDNYNRWYVTMGDSDVY